jgi:hypothetical protein
MISSRTITLFTENRETGQEPISFVASIVFHLLAIGLVCFSILYSPQLSKRAFAQHYNIRRLNLDTPDEQRPRPASDKIEYPIFKPSKLQAQAGGAASMLQQSIRAPKGPQTLLQPDLPKQIALAEALPLPSLVIWSPSKIVVKAIVAPQPAKPTAANVTPSPAPPIQEVNLADINIATSRIEHPKLPLQASTTSPVRVQAQLDVQLPPTSISQVSAQPTPAAVMSLSNMAMEQGTVVLPPVNESAQTDSHGTLAPGKAQNSHAPGNQNHDGYGGTAQAKGGAQGNSGAGTNNGLTATGEHASNGIGSGKKTSSTKIALPKDGQFGSVVVGAALEDQFPELNHVWAGRLAYTVYLHVGLARSWILQYSLPLTDNAQTGTVARLDAPWPFNIVRPNLDFDDDEAEAIMVHGYVNQAGHFEGLHVVFPPQFSQTQFVLASLQQWQFRPAARNGQPTRVEVLIIIPEEMR